MNNIQLDHEKDFNQMDELNNEEDGRNLEEDIIDELNNEEDGHNLEEDIIQMEEISEDEEQRPNLQTVENTVGSQIREFLPNWVQEYHISQIAVNALLKNLISCGISGLPKDSRTLIGTPKLVHIEKMGTGYFWYHGLENCLSGIENYISKPELNTLNLSFNIDGLPIANSSKSQFWPILVNVTNVKQFAPQVVAVFSGDSKPPSVGEYLQKFVDELQNLLESGIQINNIKFSIKIDNFICDTPARSFIKCEYKLISYVTYAVQYFFQNH